MIPPLQVLRHYKSPAGWVLLPIHYSHDPAKGPDWYRTERQNYPTQLDWDREQEIDFSLHLGNAAYPNYRPSVHLVDSLPVIPELQLDLMMDFNVAPMLWEYGQVVNGWGHVLGEIKLDPARIDMVVDEFRNRFPAHPGGIGIYGDATSRRRLSQTAQSDYDLVRIAFRGYPSEVSFHVPVDNPDEKDRRNAVNLKLRPPEGAPGIKIVRGACPELDTDLQEVVLRPDQAKILKVYDSKDPYSRRTHASDAFGYWVWARWPVLAEASRLAEQRRGRMKEPKPELIGDIEPGLPGARRMRR